jgi:hypothetical protein
MDPDPKLDYFRIADIPRTVNNDFGQRLSCQLPICRTTIPRESLNAGRREIFRGSRLPLLPGQHYVLIRQDFSGHLGTRAEVVILSSRLLNV